jgi:hypothetical protein
MNEAKTQASPNHRPRPPFSDPEVARELGRLGGIASGISRRNRSRKQLERSA